MIELENRTFENFPETEESQDNDQSERQVSKQYIDTLPHIKAFEEINCCVCMDEVKKEEIITILPCFHKFHSECVDGWLLIKPSCPICKTRINS